MQQDHVRRAVTELVRARLADETRAHGAKTSLARRLGCSAAHITKILKGTVGVGDSFIRAIAAEWCTTPAQLEAEALKAAPPQAKDRYPNRTEGLRLAAQMKHWPRAALEKLEREPLPPNDDAPPAYWVIRAYHFVQQHVEYEPAVRAAHR